GGSDAWGGSAALIRRGWGTRRLTHASFLASAIRLGRVMDGQFAHRCCAGRCKPVACADSTACCRTCHVRGPRRRHDDLYFRDLPRARREYPVVRSPGEECVRELERARAGNISARGPAPAGAVRLWIPATVGDPVG